MQYLGVVENSDDTYCGCLYFTTNALARLMTKMAEEEFSSTGLAPSYAFLLMSVNHRPGINPTELGMQLHLRPSTITRLIDKMESKGFLERKYERKRTHVFPMEPSQQLEMKLKRCWTNLLNRYARAIGTDESARLTSGITEAMSRIA